jgi:hypothetical protein
MAKRKTLRKLYMAFPDGALNYVCAECDAHCCKGFGFGGSAKEMERVFELYPEVAPLTLDRAGSWVSMMTLATGCVLLDTDNFCRIEKEHDKSLKPSLCNIFPFNGFLRFGDVIAVTPHSLCPMRLQVPPRPGEVQGTHADIERAIDSSVFWEVWVPSIPKLMLSPARDAAEALEQEEAFRDRCGAALGVERFGDVLLAASADPAALRAIRARLVRLLGVGGGEWPADRDVLDDMLLALASSIRLQFTSLEPERVLHALLVGEIGVRNAASVARVPLTLKAAYEILSGYSAVMLLLGHGDQPAGPDVNWNRKSPKYDDAGMVFATYIALKELASGAGVLPALERALPDSMPVGDRWAVIQRIAGQFARRKSQAGRRRLPVLRQAGAGSQ